MLKGTFRRTGIWLTALALTFTGLGLSACRSDKDKDKNPAPASSTSVTAPSVQASPTPAAVKLSQADVPKIQDYIASCVNGPFREYTSFPDFISVQQLPAVIFSGSEQLVKATREVGLVSFSRSNYEQYLQENFNPDITLPLSADYVIGYDKDTDSFRNDYELARRNFRPSSFWLDPELSQAGDNIYFDAYEISYEYVNPDTGREERENPIARMVVDDVTIGFSAPIVRHDLHLIDYRPLAKTRYTIRRNKSDGFYMVSKTKLARYAAYKASAMKIFGEVEARTGKAFRLGGGTMKVRDWASEDAHVLGTLEEGTWLWFVDCLPNSGFYLGAPGATYAVFNYNYGFGFLPAGNIG